MNYTLPNNCQIKTLSDIYTEYFGYPSTGYFVEVGAHDGESHSNTSCLADHGWSGLYIEPIKSLYNKCMDRHTQNDNIIVANVAIGLEEGYVPIYYGDTLTTLNKEQKNRYLEIDWAQHIVWSDDMCYQMRLDDLMTKLEVPKNFDILVVDVEGKESEVFKTFNLKEWNPKMMIIELEDDHHSFQKYPKLIKEIKDLRSYIESQGYVPVFRDYINTIFVKEELKK